MSEPAPGKIADAPMDESHEIDALLAPLRTAGADRFDPVRWRYIEALAKRAAAHRASAGCVLGVRLARALAELKERFDLAQRDAGEAVAWSTQRYPHAAGDLQQLLAAGDFKGVRRLSASLRASEPGASLGELVRRLDQHSSENTGALPGQGAGSRSELKAVRDFRNTWSKLSVDIQVARALEQAPKNAGPINSHMLVLRSLELMRDISPDYLNRFMSYVDTLLCLDQGDHAKQAPAKKTQAARAPKK
ncbi:DUF2894 domain-containing protein [Noviherbaspirillum sp. UKPF54]|uniref:DUF2894 domain-containing protein n=1 Tax=Noviherbaspirillum sp. UKPF54 TaxID=2601898 RepID=UPI0011B0F893|nr:DUF2894 domain-containing protein [Noviherbaspirillum sp. UKPF54]QDZ27126.1 DUF2894 domain-containing protein [Noviherbaspirillum sp. UKPF54]